MCTYTSLVGWSERSTSVLMNNQECSWTQGAAVKSLFFCSWSHESQFAYFEAQLVKWHFGPQLYLELKLSNPALSNWHIEPRSGNSFHLQIGKKVTDAFISTTAAQRAKHPNAAADAKARWPGYLCVLGLILRCYCSFLKPWINRSCFHRCSANSPTAWLLLQILWKVPKSNSHRAFAVKDPQLGNFVT